MLVHFLLKCTQEQQHERRKQMKYDEKEKERSWEKEEEDVNWGKKLKRGERCVIFYDDEKLKNKTFFFNFFYHSFINFFVFVFEKMNIFFLYSNTRILKQTNSEKGAPAMHPFQKRFFSLHYESLSWVKLNSNIYCRTTDVFTFDFHS